MEHFKQFSGQNYYFTTSAAEIPPDVRLDVEGRASVDFRRDRVLAFCGVDSWFKSNKQVWVLVTDERIVVSGLGGSIEQNFFSQLSGVETHALAGVALLSAGNSTGLFGMLTAPHSRLTDRLFHIIQARWLEVRRQASAPPQPAPPTSIPSIEALERLAKLREAGHLTDEEFVAQKRHLLDSHTTEARPARSQNSSAATDFGARRLCPDGNCVGVLDAEGRCRVCHDHYRGRSTA